MEQYRNVLLSDTRQYSRGVGTFRDGTHHEKYQRGGWVKMANIEKYFGTFRSQFHEKLTKIVKKLRFFPDFYQILEKF